MDGSAWNSGDPNYENSVLVANLSEGNYEGKGIHYFFELDDGDYAVELVFYDYWKSETRVSDVLINGTVVKENYVSAFGAPETYTFDTTVSGGNLVIDVIGGEGNRDNMMLAGIKITRINA